MAKANMSENNIYALYRGHADVRDAAKTLRTNLEFSGIDQEIRSIAVTSSEMNAGKSTVAICLGMAMAEAGKRVLLIDNDLRDPSIENELRMNSRYTLPDLLTGRVRFEEACLPTNAEGLFVLDLGSRRVGNPVEVLSSAKYKALIRQAKDKFDFVIIDTPPIGLFIDAAITSQMVDGVVFVINAGKTTPKEVKEALGQLEKANAHVLGAVLNNVQRKNSNYYYYDQSGQKKRRKKSKAKHAAQSEKG